MNEIRFRLAIDAQEYLRYYQGEVNSVMISTTDGRVVQFPAGALHKYVDHLGVNGSFRIVYDDDNKLVSCDRISN